MENVVEVEKDLKVQERVSYCNCDSQTTPGHLCELESDKIEVEQNFYLNAFSQRKKEEGALFQTGGPK